MQCGANSALQVGRIALLSASVKALKPRHRWAGRKSGPFSVDYRLQPKQITLFSPLRDYFDQFVSRYLFVRGGRPWLLAICPDKAVRETGWTRFAAQSASPQTVQERPANRTSCNVLPFSSVGTIAQSPSVARGSGVISPTPAETTNSSVTQLNSRSNGRPGSTVGLFAFIPQPTCVSSGPIAGRDCMRRNGRRA